MGFRWLDTAINFFEFLCEIITTEYKNLAININSNENNMFIRKNQMSTIFQ